MGGKTSLFVAAAIVTIAALAAIYSTFGKEDIKVTPATGGKIPAIDAQAPSTFKTATFSMG